MAEEQMPKLNLDKDSLKLTTSDLHYMKQVEEQNLKRANNLKRLRMGNRISGILLAGIAASIYAYTIYAVKQEKFLDDFDEPETVSDED